MDSSASRVLIVDDDVAVGRVLVAQLAQSGYRASHSPSVERALAVLESEDVHLVITDLRMPGADGFAMLSHVKARCPGVPAIMITAHGTIPTAVAAMREGAADFITKPFEREEVVATVQRALDASARNRALPPPSRVAASRFIGSSPQIKELVERLSIVSSSSATVLLLGENGTGKELAASAIHEGSPRRDGPFVVVDLGALPENLIESELFGHEKGAFTGATHRRPGRVELAEGGTLFLDEVGEVPPFLQIKLLRLIQEKQYWPLGAARSQQADVRFVAATHRDLPSMVASGAFRQDLYYRLNVLPVRLPTLRERPADLATLVSHFTDHFARQNDVVAPRLDASACAVLRAHTWPGNVRELQNFMERVTILYAGRTIDGAMLERELGEAVASAPVAPAEPRTLETMRQEAERAALEQAIRKAGGNRTLAARILGISRRSLYNKMAALGLAGV